MPRAVSTEERTRWRASAEARAARWRRRVSDLAVRRKDVIARMTGMREGTARWERLRRELAALEVSERCAVENVRAAEERVAFLSSREVRASIVAGMEELHGGTVGVSGDDAGVGAGRRHADLSNVVDAIVVFNDKAGVVNVRAFCDTSYFYGGLQSGYATLEAKWSGRREPAREGVGIADVTTAVAEAADMVTSPGFLMGTALMSADMRYEEAAPNRSAEARELGLLGLGGGRGVIFDSSAYVELLSDDEARRRAYIGGLKSRI